MAQNASADDAQNTTTPDDLAAVFEDEGMTATGHGADGDGDRTVVVENDGSMSASGVEALGERNGYFLFASDAAEFTLTAYADCAWKSR